MIALNLTSLIVGTIIFAHPTAWSNTYLSHRLVLQAVGGLSLSFNSERGNFLNIDT